MNPDIDLRTVGQLSTSVGNYVSAVNRCICVIGFSATEPVFGHSFSLPTQNCD